MPSAYYMKFAPRHRGSLDRLGGLLSQLPLAFPRCDYSGDEMVFLAQFYCAPPRLDLPETLCVQLYQVPDVGEGGEPLPVALCIPAGAPRNNGNRGFQQRQIEVHDISWEERTDPDSEPEFPDDLPLYASKAGGRCLHFDVFDEGEKFVMQIKEEPGNFNFAGRTCIVCLASDGSLKVHLG